MARSTHSYARTATIAAVALVGVVVLSSYQIFTGERKPESHFGLLPTFEGTSPVWDIGPRSKVLMHVEQSVRYPLNGSEGDAQWSTLVPGDGIMHAGPDHTPFMPSLFHQLRCLDIIRRAYVGTSEEDLTAVSRHCLNYLRQMVLCRGDLRLEPVVDPFSKHAVQPWGKHTCDDWTAVYSAYEQNAEEYTRWQSTR